MKITKAHIQIGILAIGGLSVAGMWLAPQFNTPPSISVPAKQTAPSTVTSTPSPKALPDTVAPVVKKKPKPQSVTPTLTLDVNAQKLIKRSEQLAVAKMDSQIAEEKSRTRKANQKESSEGRSDYVPSVSVIEQPYSPPSVSPHSSQLAIDRFSLSGLFVDGNEASAYLALDGGQPFLVKAGDSVKGVSITNINGNGVRLKQGARIRVLEGGL
ncbi:MULTISPECIES: hypothetical protein [Gammaproteobacteria]|uniref:Translation initiation factor 2 n=8 Tax=Vibrio harveyi group TaxID=717610 RepID=A0A085YMI9_VIBPH|nr:MULTISPECIES: hypothetical protein [Gammaproteobacteria]ETZ12099.1 hypothetical protein AJ90_20755 [Vibrio parahaemolyticus M0605]AIL49912.1 Translation initiation factor 2 [Vibrio parahaemolyticus]AKC05708.1 hypothetical protein pVA1088 [Vibrio parahaemolyticus]AQZ36757.1 hypothetical protein [Vibrio parahaemolyticus v110]ARR10101.1 hypothetical protein Vc3S01_p10071 [Vibrio campbellii]